jgi:hypothetical protein
MRPFQRAVFKVSSSEYDSSSKGSRQTPTSSKCALCKGSHHAFCPASSLTRSGHNGPSTNALPSKYILLQDATFMDASSAAMGVPHVSSPTFVLFLFTSLHHPKQEH